MSDFRLPPLNVGERLYRALLALYPPRFRRAFALDLVETFRDQRREARRAGVPAAAFWLTVLQDVLVHASAEWVGTIWRVFERRNDADREESPMAAIPHALRFAELRFAARRLLRVRSFSVATVLVLSIGIGATTAVFSIVNGVLLRPLPYPRSDRLVALKHTVQVSGVKDVDQSDGSILYYQEHARAFEGIAAARFTDVNLAAASARDRPERVPALQTSANLFDVLQIRPLLGRTFQSGEDRLTAAPVAILSYALWQARFHGDASVVGARVVVDGVSRQIVGVMPRGFAYPNSTIEIFIPIAFDPPNASVGSFNYLGVGRLRDGVSADAARADLSRIVPHMIDEFPSGIPPAMWKQAHLEPMVLSLHDYVVGSVARILWILLASVSLVLIIACANVANLFLVRGESRQLELAVRGALGSGIAGILAQSLSESVLLSVIGGVLGIGLAAFAVHLAATVGGALGLPRLDEVTVDARVIVFAFAASAFAAAFVSVLPVWRARRVPIAMVLRGGGRGTTGQRQGARSALVIAQTALALVLVAASGLLARSFMRLETVKPGFDPDHLVVARLMLPASSYATPASRLRFYNAVLERLRATPGIESASLGDWVPLSDDHSDVVISVEDHPLPPNAVPNVHLNADVEGQYFRTMRISLLSGRTFGAMNSAGTTPEAVVSRAFARRYWGNKSPIGKRILRGISGPWNIVVGEVGDAHYDALDQPANDIVYFPIKANDGHAAFIPSSCTVFARSSLPTGTATAAIREIVHGLDPSLPTYGETAVADVVRAASARAREMLLLLAIASGIALVLGAVGIYGTLAYSVSLRQREIGVRIALGAQPSHVRHMIARNGVGLAVVGVAIGVVAAAGVTRFLRSLLYDVSPTDPLILIGACVTLLLVALIASWIPARRAASLDPLNALHNA